MVLDGNLPLEEFKAYLAKNDKAIMSKVKLG